MGSAGHYLAARRIRAVQSGGCGEAEEQQSSGDTMYLIHVLSAINPQNCPVKLTGSNQKSRTT